jgi:hypothetical protein
VNRHRRLWADFGDPALQKPAFRLLSGQGERLAIGGKRVGRPP